MRFTSFQFTYTGKVTVCQCFILNGGNQTPGMHFTHFHYIKWPISHCTTLRQIIPAAPVSLSVSWISGLSGLLWCIGSLPLHAYLSFFLSLFTLSLTQPPLCLSVSFLPYASHSNLLFPNNHPCLSLFLSVSVLCLSFLSSAATNWVLPPSESSDLSVHGISAIQMSGRSQFGSHCVLAIILAMSLSLSPSLL